MISKLYHLSDRDMNGETLRPRVPSNYMTRNGYEDGKIARVCFSNSIDGALIAMSSNIKDKIFYIHEPEDYTNLNIVNNRDIISKRYVPDAQHTGETWVLDKVKLKCIGKIQVGEAKDTELKYTYGKNTATLYPWNWRYIQRINENLIDDNRPVLSNLGKTNIWSNITESNIQNMDLLSYHMSSKYLNNIEEIDLTIDEVLTDKSRFNEFIDSDLSIEDLKESVDEKIYGKCLMCGIKRKYKDDSRPCPACKHDHIGGLNESVMGKDDISPVYIILTKTGSKMGRAIQKVTNTEFNHASISFDPDLKRMYSFGKGDSGKVGFALESKDNTYLKFYDDVRCQVYIVFLDKKQSLKMKLKLDEFIATKNKLKYHYLGLIGYLLKKPITNNFAMFCSEFVDSLFKLVDVDLTGKTSALVHPFDFAKSTSNLIYKIFEGPMKDYKVNLTKSKINKAYIHYKHKLPIAVQECVIGDVYLETSLGDFMVLFKNFDLISRNMYIRPIENGNFKAIQPNLLAMVKRSRTRGELVSFRKDISVGLSGLTKLRDRLADLEKSSDPKSKNPGLYKRMQRGLTSEKVGQHVEWLKGDFRNAINARMKEIEGKNVKEEYINTDDNQYAITEAKDFPIQFDKDGNLLIKNMKKINYQEEYGKSHKLLLIYNKSNNIEGMKYELSKLWFINSLIEDKLYNNTDKLQPSDKTNYLKIRARVLNDFNTYLNIVNRYERDFNFIEYYNNTPFSDVNIKIHRNTLIGISKIIKDIVF